MRAALCFAVLVCAGCTAAIPDGAARAKAEDDIREAVFRYQLQKYRLNVEVCFLSIGTDPTDEFMKRFADQKPVVKKASQSIFVEHGIHDKVTRESGVLYSATTITWVSGTEVEVEGGHFVADLSASGGTYHVKKDKGKWVVTGDVMKWIS